MTVMEICRMLEDEGYTVAKNIARLYFSEESVEGGTIVIPSDYEIYPNEGEILIETSDGGHYLFFKSDFKSSQPEALEYSATENTLKSHIESAISCLQTEQI